MHIHKTKIEDINTKYHAMFYSNVQEVVAIRKNLRITQSSMSHYCKVSLRTIQNFEAYNSINHKVLFTYKEILKL